MNAELHSSVQTELLSVASVVAQGISLSIPSYQRPYVWSQDDASKLWDDISNACKAKEAKYFIGTTLSAQSDNSESLSYELIDGQQRTTTLLLITLAFRAAKVVCPLAEVSVIGKKARLTFEIRTSVQNLIGSAAGLDVTKPGLDAIDSDEYLRHIDANLKFFIQKVEALKENEENGATELAEYIYERVHWVNNIVPQDLDLNRLFASMNTTGIQLEPVDLLKAKLFKKIKTEKPLYSQIWQACEHMENYFERNLRQLFPNADWNSVEYETLSQFSKKTFTVAVTSELEDKANVTPAKSLLDLFEEDTPLDTSGTKQPQKDEEDSDADPEAVIEDAAVYCRSIISFELLLIHTLRIFCAGRKLPDLEPRIKAGNLMACFEILTARQEDEIKAFVELLWQVRYQFDTWVVKWVEHIDRNDPQLRLTNISRSKSSDKYYINRSIRDVGLLAQLQSVLNFTGDRSAQYWLTALLAKLVTNPEQNGDKVVLLLEQIDNQLSLSEETQKIASFKIAQGRSVKLDIWANKEEYLRSAKGTSFEHYWFQKLEYVLWKAYKDAATGGDKVKRYRITSKNSIEHVHPQHEEFQKILEGESDTLNAFGNLVLLSPGENSSYGNQTVGKKMDDFKNKPGIDSMKLWQIYLAYEKGERVWGKTQVEKHQQEVLELLRNHYE
jgi:uncharacterized protein with ParB-like and HNH nuclease domain